MLSRRSRRFRWAWTLTCSRVTESDSRVVRGQKHLGGRCSVLRDGQLGDGDETDDDHEDGDDPIRTIGRSIEGKLAMGALLLIGYGQRDLAPALNLVESLDDDPLRLA